MPNDSGDSTSQRVPGFIYLDMDRVKSISSRMDEGYIEEKIEQEETNSEVASSLTGSIKARILGVGSGSLSGTIEGRAGSTSGVEESRALHHYYVPLLEDWLEESEGEWFHDIQTLLDEIDGKYADRAARQKIASSVSEGDIVRIRGDMEVLDFSTSLEFVNGMITAVNKIDSALPDEQPDNDSADDGSVARSDVLREGMVDDDDDEGEGLGDVTVDQLLGISPDDLVAMDLVFEVFQEIIPDQYEEMLATRVFPPVGDSQFWFWGLIQREKLDVDPVELLSKYETSEIPNCTVLARVETITEAFVFS